jgi:MtN3 and saliva related transmembrane protein
MKGLLVDTIGMAGAVLTTVCWLPQAIHVVRSRDTAALSLTGTVAFTIGIALWLIYGLALMDWPLIASRGHARADGGDRRDEGAVRVTRRGSAALSA